MEKVVNKTGGRKISKEVIFHILIKRVPKKLLDATKQLPQKPIDAFSRGVDGFIPLPDDVFP